MLIREITYEDFNGNTVTDKLYFNLTMTEVVELEADYKGGLEDTIKRIIATEDKKALIAEFKRILLLAYGVRSEDGKRFIKSQELRDEFVQSAAFDALFMELATNSDAASAFVIGITPKEVAKLAAAQDVPLPPLPPTAA